MVLHHIVKVNTNLRKVDHTKINKCRSSSIQMPLNSTHDKLEHIPVLSIHAAYCMSIRLLHCIIEQNLITAFSPNVFESTVFAH